MDVVHPPASTIKTLLVLTALDELPNLDATVVGTEADTQRRVQLRRYRNRAAPTPRASSSTRCC